MRFMRKNTLPALFLLWVAGGPAASATAASLDVPGQFATVTAALAAAAPGDTIFVAPGTYSASTNGESFPLSLTTDSLCLFGAGMGQSILDAEQGAAVFTCDHPTGVCLRGFTVTGGWADYGGGIRVRPGSSIEIADVLFLENGARIRASAILVESEAWIHHNVIWESFDTDPADSTDPHGMACQGASTALLEQNLIGRGSGNGLVVGGTAMPTVRHNIFLQNGTPPPDLQGRGICWFSPMPLVVYHNLFFENAVAALLVPDLGGNFSGEAANDLDSADGIYGNIDADPLLVDPDHHDFRLTFGSPAIDAGDPLLPGDPDGTVADIGPFYFEQSAVDVPSYEAPSTKILSSRPNPFNPAVEIRYSIAAEEFVRLTIHDTAGRLVATLLAENVPAGNHGATWNGKNRSGDDVVSGVYFARIHAGDFSATRKLILVR